MDIHEKLPVKQNYGQRMLAPWILSAIARETIGANVPSVSVALGAKTQGAAQPKRRPSNRQRLPAVQSAAPQRSHSLRAKLCDPETISGGSDQHTRVEKLRLY